MTHKGDFKNNFWALKMILMTFQRIKSADLKKNCRPLKGFKKVYCVANSQTFQCGFLRNFQRLLKALATMIFQTVFGNPSKALGMDF